MEEPRRLRVVFDDRKMLTKSQRSDGLQRSWVFLKPGAAATVADLAAHVTKKFKLLRSCPDGVVLSMEEFVLPPFESICLLKDTDIIRIRKKDATRMDEIDVGNGPHYLQGSEFVENQNVISSDRLLAIQQFEEDSGHPKKKNNLFAHNENAIRTGNSLMLKKKRKRSDEIEGSKKKKLKNSTKKLNIAHDDYEGTSEEDDDIHFGKRGSSHVASHLEDNAENVTSTVQREKRRKKSELIFPEEAIVCTKVDKKTCRGNNEKCHQEGSSSRKNVHRTDKQSVKDGVKSSQFDGKAGRNHSSVIIEDRNGLSEENVGGHYSEKNIQNENDPDSEMEKQIVPVESRPGHIHFESSGEEQMQRQLQETQGTQWNVTTSKKQEWDKGKTLSKWNDGNGCKEHYIGKGICGKEKIGSSSLINRYEEQFSGNVISEKEKAGSNLIHFESLPTLARFPQVGDVLAYRLIELSDSWGPEVSSFRVGQVKSFNDDSMIIFLVPLPDYPILCKEDVEGNRVNSSLYSEDGSLQTHYSSLIDVRLLKAIDPIATTSTRKGMVTQEISSMDNWELALAKTNNTTETEHAQPSGMEYDIPVWLYFGGEIIKDPKIGYCYSNVEPVINWTPRNFMYSQLIDKIFEVTNWDKGEMSVKIKARYAVDKGEERYFMVVPVDNDISLRSMIGRTLDPNCSWNALELYIDQMRLPNTRQVVIESPRPAPSLKLSAESDARMPNTEEDISTTPTEPISTEDEHVHPLTFSQNIFCTDMAMLDFDIDKAVINNDLVEEEEDEDYSLQFDEEDSDDTSLDEYLYSQ